MNWRRGGTSISRLDGLLVSREVLWLFRPISCGPKMVVPIRVEDPSIRADMSSFLQLDPDQA
jgi:hypothetical protein